MDAPLDIASRMAQIDEQWRPRVLSEFTSEELRIVKVEDHVYTAPTGVKA